MVTVQEHPEHAAEMGPSREVSPNRGAAILDISEMGADGMTQSAWRSAYSIEPSKHVKLVKLSHMRYQHPNLQTISTFLRDFGMTLVKKTENERWFRGYGTDQYTYYAREGPKKFLGGAWEVESYEELEKALKLPGVQCISNGIEPMKEAPGGGFIVTLIDAEGFPMNLTYGQSPAQPGIMPEKLLVNDEVDKPRVRKFLRYEPGPAAVHKLGHYGLVVRDFGKQIAWYTKNFNLVPTNLLHVPDGDKSHESGRKFVAGFAHVDRGQELVDHHSIFFTSLPPGTEEEPHVHHSSFEVHDIDSQSLGHEWLARKKYESVWGVGRHIIGSQIFDYWWDTAGFMVEHYIDGDVVNEETPVALGPAGEAGLAAWGPEVPGEFLE